jgi:CubicO group peptidase (beta-lactamase class C family)
MSSARALSSAVGLVGALALPSIALAQPKTTADPVDRLFQPWAAATTPGCAVGVSQGGRMVVSRAYGAADLDHGVANTPETVFEAGSASKQFTAAAILLLVKDGKLALSDDIRKHLPEMPNYGTPITIDHLLHHTSGLRDWRYVAGVGGDLPGEHAHSNADALALAVRQRGLNHAPGAEYSYTNTGYTLLAVIVERVSGQSLAAFSRAASFNRSGWRRPSGGTTSAGS